MILHFRDVSDFVGVSLFPVFLFLSGISIFDHIWCVDTVVFYCISNFTLFQHNVTGPW